MQFRGLICNNINDWKAKNNMLFNVIKDYEKCTSSDYAGINGEPDLFTIEGKPILIEPKDVDFLAESKKIPLPFTDLDTSIIRQEL